jgi:hypothetical protein
VFFTHICEQLFVAMNARQKAYEELLSIKLHSEFRKIVDCQTLITRVEQLFLRMYPAQATPEREPVPRYEACIQIHLLLNQLACVPHCMRTTALLKAWTEYQWDGPSIYKEFLRDSEHQVPSASKERYLSVIYQHLRDAQEMYNTIHTEKAQVPLPTQPLVRDVVAAAAKQLGVTPQILRQRACPCKEIIYSGSFKSQKRPQGSERGFKTCYFSPLRG